MRYFLTYFKMMPPLANRMGHACFGISRWAGLNHKIEVVKVWGYYGAPQSDPNTIVGQFKDWIGVTYDLMNSYGVLKEEELRYLDMGTAISGKTFMIDEGQYHQLIDICAKRIKDQNEAIAEMTNRLKAKNIKPNSKAIFKEENDVAKFEDHRETRLKLFDIRVGMDLTGVNLNNSHTCKTLMFEIFREIGIEEKEIQKLISYNSKTLPRWSGELDEVVMHSVGPIKSHYSKRTGQTYYSRSWDGQTKLYWSVPPQNPVGHSENVKIFFKVNKQSAEKAKKILVQLQAIDKLVDGHTNNDDQVIFKPYLAELRKLIDDFSIVNVSDTMEKIIMNANYFLSASYFAICGEWSDASEVASCLSQLPSDVHEELCTIMGKTLTYESEMGFSIG